MSINYDKLFNSKIIEDMTDVDSILEYEDILFAISEKIITYRKENNLTQKDLAKILEVNQTMISKLESGRYNPTFKVIYNISRKLENSCNMFIDILDNIKERLCKMYIKEYKNNVNFNDIAKKYTFKTIDNTNLIKINYDDNYNIEGDCDYEKCTSPLPDAG